MFVNSDIDRLDFDSLDVYFHGDDLDQLDQDSSLHKLIENVKSKVQPKMAAIMKQMLSSDKKEREEAKSIRFIGSISRKFFLEMPHLVLALKDGDETIEEQAYQEQLLSQAHYLRCLSSLYHKGCLKRELDEVGLFFVGLMYHKHVSLCNLDCSCNAYNACKVLPYMTLKMRDRFVLDFDFSVFLGPGLAGIMQAIEHLNKLLKSRMRTWTSGRKGFLKDFLETFYEILVGKYMVLGKAAKPSNFQTNASNCSAGIESGFRFPPYDAANPRMCYSCRREVFPLPTSLKTQQDSMCSSDPVFDQINHLLGIDMPIPNVYSSNT